MVVMVFRLRRRRGGVSVISVLYQSVKGSASLGCKFFLFRIEPFPEGAYCAEKQTERHKNCLPCENGEKSVQSLK